MNKYTRKTYNPKMLLYGKYISLWLTMVSSNVKNASNEKIANKIIFSTGFLRSENICIYRKIYEV